MTVIAGLIGALIALLFGKSAIDRLQMTRKKNEIGETVVKNHEVAAQMEAAKTDEEADAALLADAQSDHR